MIGNRYGSIEVITHYGRIDDVDHWMCECACGLRAILSTEAARTSFRCSCQTVLSASDAKRLTEKAREKLKFERRAEITKQIKDAAQAGYLHLCINLREDGIKYFQDLGYSYTPPDHRLNLSGTLTWE